MRRRRPDLSAQHGEDEKRQPAPDQSSHLLRKVVSLAPYNLLAGPRFAAAGPSSIWRKATQKLVAGIVARGNDRSQTPKPPGSAFSGWCTAEIAQLLREEGREKERKRERAWFTMETDRSLPVWPLERPSPLGETVSRATDRPLGVVRHRLGSIHAVTLLYAHAR